MKKEKSFSQGSYLKIVSMVVARNNKQNLKLEIFRKEML